MQGSFSIRRRLLLGMVSAVFLTWAAVLWFAYLATSHEVEEVYDAALAQYAKVLATLLVHEAGEEADRRAKVQLVVDQLGMDAIEASPLLTDLVSEYLPAESDVSGDYLSMAPMAELGGHPYESKIAFLVESDEGKVLLRSTSAMPWPGFRPGFRNLIDDKGDWRVFGLAEPAHGLKVTVGERMALRLEIQSEILQNGLWPMLAALPLIGLIIWLVIDQGLQPLRKLAQTVDSRSPTSLEPVAESRVPQEAVPMINALNQLFERVRRVLENERRFTANAAHELRTPLAALKTHAQVLQLSAEGESARNVRDILQGVERAAHLVDQLLALALAEGVGNDQLPGSGVDVAAVTREVISDLTPLAFDHGIELVFDDSSVKPRIHVESGLLRIMLRNLLDNAIRYTRPGDSVSVLLTQDRGSITLQITDTGPGIPEDHRERLLQRFQRGDSEQVEGAGLGLSIVQQICDRYHFTLTLSDNPSRPGLAVIVEMPPDK